VQSVIGPGRVMVEDMNGRRHEVSLLALEPKEPDPVPGDWLVVHSGYAIDRVEASEAAMTLAEFERGGAAADVPPRVDQRP
jgi:hydrogenase maturation factor